MLINIGSGSLSGACIRYAEGQLPTILYARHLPLEGHEGEDFAQAIVRTLEALTNLLVTEGAPALQRFAGSGTADRILISVDAPWQTTVLRVETIEAPALFSFTRHLITEEFEKPSFAPAGQFVVNESLVGTILDGYEVHAPFGKKASQAKIVILASAIVERLAKAATLVVRRSYHTKEISFISGASLRYQAVRAAFPLERNYLILDAMGPEIAFALVRQGLLVAVHDTPFRDPETTSWITEVTKGLTELSEKYPLPYVIFLLARSEDVEKLSAALAAGNIGALWLSDNPPKILTLTAQHLHSLIKVVGEIPVDLILALMTIYGEAGLENKYEK